MAGIINVNNSYNIENRKFKNKLSFELGEKFSARIIDSDEENGEVTLKLPDGWEFNAKISDKLEYIPREIVKFEVEGFEEGKLKLKITNEIVNEEKESDGLETVFAKENIPNTEENYKLLKEMVKFNIPLTRENISNVKTILEMKNKGLSEQKINDFINKYINSKGIKLESSEGKNIENTLKSFFNSLKNLSSEDILIFYENDVDFTEENIKSFLNIFKEDGTLWKETKEINSLLKEGFENNLIDNNDETINITKEELTEFYKGLDENDILNRNNVENYIKQNLDSKKLNNEDIKELEKFLNVLKEDNIENNEKTNINNSNDFINKEERIKINEALKKDVIEFIEKFSEEGNPIKDNKGKELENIDKTNNYTDVNKDEILENKQNNKLDSNLVQNKSLEKGNVEEVNVKFKEIETQLKGNANNKEEISKNTLNKENINNEQLKNLKEDSSIKNSSMSKINNVEITKTDLIKLELQNKIKEIKNTLKIVMETINKDEKSSGEIYNKILSIIGKHSNDFKLFNTLANEYYYLDLPVNIKEEECQCKLIIKDDRKSGKNIDSKNVKIATSIKTINLDEVDAFISVRNNLMDINIKCKENWVGLLNKNKNKLMEMLEDSNYNIYIKVDKKEEQFNISSCREFFQDNNLNTINIKV